MRVIFLEDVPNIARIGETKEVADGYGRNFLIPKKLALPADSPDAAQIATRLQAARKKTDEELAGLLERLEDKAVTIKAKVGAKDRLYGSITSADIAAELENVAGLAIDKKKIELAEPIRQLGSYEVVIRLGQDVMPKIKVTVIAEEKKEEAEKPKKKKAEKKEKKEKEVEKKKPKPKAKKKKKVEEAEEKPKPKAKKKKAVEKVEKAAEGEKKEKEKIE